MSEAEIKRMYKTLKKHGEKHGVAVTYKGSGHFHLQGELLVNYYPYSKNKSAHVQGSHKISTFSASPSLAVKLTNVCYHMKKDTKLYFLDERNASGFLKIWDKINDKGQCK